MRLACNHRIPVKITLDLELLQTNKHQKYNVQELKGDKVLAEYELTGKESITIENKGVTSLKVSPVGSGELAQEKPDKFNLKPSYPNPFNPSTTIEYQVPEQVQVNVEVFNMIGKKVRTLLAGERQRARIPYNLTPRHFRAECILFASRPDRSSRSKK
ncbi:MAG: T9SS type A sorting domain-containing protein [Fodinibius sp.]|nr:T9SS type A sorting domain-containing protein [Fodinibius sp.]